MKKNRLTKIMAISLALVMLLSAFPVSAFAAEDTGEGNVAVETSVADETSAPADVSNVVDESLPVTDVTEVPETLADDDAEVIVSDVVSEADTDAAAFTEDEETDPYNVIADVNTETIGVTDDESAIETEVPEAETATLVEDETLADEDEIAEEETEEPLFSQIAEDSVLSAEQLAGIDFSSARLIMSCDGSLILDPEHVISAYDGTYLLQYESPEIARNAYSYYYGKAAFVEVDSVMTIASGNGAAAGATAMTEGDNPINELAEAVSQNPGRVGGGVIAVIDTGINGYGGNVIEAVSMVGDDTSDANGHGTRMAQMITDEDPNAQMISIKAIGANGTGDVSAVYAAIEYAISRGVSVINLSVVAPKTADNAAIVTAIQEAISRGIVVIAAAGNQGRNAGAYIPASIPGVYTIGAADASGAKQAFSNYGSCVNYNVIADSTSEAAARFAGIYSATGSLEADMEKVFPTDYTAEDEPVEPENPDAFELADWTDEQILAEADRLFATPNSEGYINWLISLDAASRNRVIALTGAGTQYYDGSLEDPLFHISAVSADRYGDGTYAWTGSVNGTRPYYSYSEIGQTQGWSTSWLAMSRADGLALSTLCIDPPAADPHYSGTFSAFNSDLDQRANHSDLFTEQVLLVWWFSNSTYPGWQYRNALYGAVAPNLNTSQALIWEHILISMLYDPNGNWNYRTNFSVASLAPITDRLNAMAQQLHDTNSFTFTDDAGVSHTFRAPDHCYWTDDQGNQHISNQVQWFIPGAGGTGNGQRNLFATPEFFEAPQDNSAYIRVVKTSSNTTVTNQNPNYYSLSGARYGVYSDSACTDLLATLTTDATGASNTAEIQMGAATSMNVYVKEISAPAHYAVSATVASQSLTTAHTESSPLTVNMTDAPLTGYLRARKVSANTAVTNGNNNYRFANIQFEVFTDPSCSASTRAVNAAGNPFVLTATSDGYTNTMEMAAGVYYVREVSSSLTGTGYRFNSTPTQVTVTESHTATAPRVATVSDTPETGYLQAIKVSTNPDISNGNRMYSLAGIQFGVYTASSCAENTRARNAAGNTFTLTTRADGRTQEMEMPLGTYWIREIEDSTGNWCWNSTPVQVTVTAANTVTAPVRATVENEPGSDPIGIVLTKRDAETPTGNAQGVASLEGAQFTVKYYDATSATGTPERTWVFRTNANGIVRFESSALVSGDDLYLDELGTPCIPAGTITIQETREPDGYLLDDTIYTVHFTMQSNGRVAPDVPKVEHDNVGDLQTQSLEQIIRADLQFSKLDIDGNSMANIPFLIELLDENGDVLESHVIVTDENGRLNTADRPHTGSNVNSLDSYASDGVFTNESMLNGNTGVWFGEQSARSDEKGALIYGTYRITELRCAANEGQDLLSQEVTVEENNKVYQLPATFIDLSIHPESDLVDTETGTKSTRIAEDVSLTDTFRYDHLKTTKTYRLETEIIYVSEDGQTQESLGTNSLTFTPPAVDATQTANGTIDNTIVVSTIGKNGGTLNAVDRLYVVDEDGTEVLLVTHNEDLSDARQRVTIPYMGTTATDTATGDHVGALAAEASITDVVEYRNLAHGGMYILEGTLRDAATGEVITGLDGNPCVVRKTVLINSRVQSVTDRGDSVVGPTSGEITMPAFHFDASGMAGHTLVVTEVLYDHITEDVVIDHNDLTDEGQSIHYVEPSTEARDSHTNTRTSVVGQTTIIDKVTLSNTVPGMAYTVTGDLVYQADCTDANGVEHTKGEVIATHDPVLVLATGSTTVVELEYTVDAAALEGVTGVVFEDVYHNNVLVGTHHDYDAIPQTPHWPKVRTTAVDGTTEMHTGLAVENASIVDTVSLTNLVVGDTYVVRGTLMDKETGEPVVINGETVTAESEQFTADAANMTVEMTFTFDASQLGGHSVVVFEKLFCIGTDAEGQPNETDVARHEDLTDEGQTIDYPDLHTNASDGKTEDEVGTIGETETIVDTVTYEKLHVGEEYTITGTLHYTEDFTDVNGVDHAAGDAVLDENGEEITASVTFTAETAEGSVDLVYTVNSELLRGTTIVVFEDVLVKNITVASHADIDDENQRVDYPDVHTSATDDQTEDHVGSAGETITLTDVVALTNLTVGKTYTVSGVVMDQSTGEAFLDEEGNEITAQTEPFEATDTEMTVELTFEVNSSQLAGTTLVVFEDLIHNDVTVSFHHEIDDEDQSVHIPEIGTTATANDTEEHVTGAHEEVTITDVVAYENLLTDGREYTVSGYLVDKENGNPITIDGEQITAETTFVPEETSGEVEIVFTFDGSALAGTTVVAFETVTYKGIEVAVHADIEDEGQTVYIPDIHTNAHDADTEIDHTEAREATLIDTVSYTNLLPGKEYTVSGYLVDKATGEPLTINGEKITAETTFTADAAEGDVDVTFTFDASILAGQTIVVFETLYYNGIEIAVHADIEDEDQTDYVPEIGTTAIAQDTNDHITLADTEVVIIDTVEYSGLKPNTKYTVTGTLMDQETGDPILVDGAQVTSSATFVTGAAEEGEVSVSGSVDVTFTFNGVSLAGKNVVAFETLYQQGRQVAVHADIEDEAQTVNLPEIRTQAHNAADGGKETDAVKNVTLVDVVSYSGLFEGETYTMYGQLIDKSTGNVIATASEVFTAAAGGSGEVELSVTIDATPYAGKDVVFFETCFMGEVEDVDNPTDEDIPVGEHHDLTDEGQTIHVKPNGRVTTSTPGTGVPRTGDASNMMLIAGIAGVAAIAMGVTGGVQLGRKRKERDEDEE